MTVWDEGHWVNGNVARVINVFAGGDSAWIDFTWESLIAHQGTGHVGWRRLVSEDFNVVAGMLQIARLAMELDRRLHLRVTNDGRIVGVQTA